MTFKALILAGVASVALSSAALAADNFIETHQMGTGNKIDSTQTGSNNTAGIQTTGNWIWQDGTNNALTINQSGNHNTIGANDTFKNGAVTVSDQIGNRNSLNIKQSGAYNTAKYRQNGNDNGTMATGASTGTSAAPLLGRTYTSPNGKWNYIEQSAENVASRSDIDVRQNPNGTSGGVGNGIIALQSATASSIKLIQQSGNASNLAYFDQAGRSQSIDLNQSQSGSNRNLADIRQTGIGSTVTSTQGGSGLDLFVKQSGGPNSVSTTQANASDSFIQVAQFNDSILLSANTVTATQSLGSQMQLTVSQVGYGQKVDSGQQGNILIASVDQTGHDNTYYGRQSGSSNTANVMQGSSANLANVLQTGSGSTVTITQNRAR